MYLFKILLVAFMTSLISFSLFSQTYLMQEDFNNCALPANWGNSTLGSGWQIGTAVSLESATFPIADNGSCIAVINDAVTLGNNASLDVLAMPKIDISGVSNLIISYDLMRPFGASNFYIEYSHDSINWSLGHIGAIAAHPSLAWQTTEFSINTGLFSGVNDLWLRLSYKDFGSETIGIAIDNFRVFESADNDLKLSFLKKNDWSEFVGQKITGEILNYGSNVINNYTLNWQLDNGVINSQFIDSFTNHVYYTPLVTNFLDPFVYSSFEALNAYSFNTNGSYELKVWTSLPNGIVDSNPLNDTLVMVVNALASLPEKRVLLEKYSHTTCSPCYVADGYFELMLEDHPFVSGVSIHAAINDPYTIPEGDTLHSNYIYGNPSFVGDRKILGFNSFYRMDQYQGETDDLNLAAEALEAVSVSITNFSYDNIASTIQFDVEAQFYGDYISDLGISAYVLEDSVLGYQVNAPDPNNYYHNHVVRAILGGSWGAPFQMSDVVGGTYSKTFQYTIPADQNPDHFSFIGIVQKMNLDLSERYIINCTPEIDMEDVITLAISEVEIDKDIIVIPNPFNTVFKVQINNSHNNIVKVYSLSGSLVYENMNYTNLTGIDLSTLESGMYMLSVEAKDKQLSYELIVKE